jgi:hypothetical protein
METQDKPYFEADHDQVVLCKKFLRDIENIDKRTVYNPFTCRVIKKGSSTYVSVYHQVKSYLEKIDDEEYHSPIKNIELFVDRISALKCEHPDINLEKTNQCRVSETFMENVKVNLKKLVSQKLKDEKSLKTNSYHNWRYDSSNLLCTDINYEKLVSNWVHNHPEIYSFIDHYKPDVLKNKYLMKHLITYDEPATYFINYIQNCCDVYLNKMYEYGFSKPSIEKRYPCAIIMFWIYSDFIVESRKFLKKNTKKFSEYIASKPANEVRLSKTQMTSIALAWFLFRTKPDQLEPIKTNYEQYFNTIFTEMLNWFNSERIYSKVYFRHLFLNFMSNRVKPYRYIDIKYDVFSEFDKIVQFISNPIPIDESESEEEDDEDSIVIGRDNGKEEV